MIWYAVYDTHAVVLCNTYSYQCMWTHGWCPWTDECDNITMQRHVITQGLKLGGMFTIYMVKHVYIKKIYTVRNSGTSNKLSEQVSCVLILHLKLKHTLHKLVFYLKRIQRFRIAYVLMCIKCRLLVLFPHVCVYKDASTIQGCL